MYLAAAQTLAYLLPVLSLALQKAEAEFEELAKIGKANQAGKRHFPLSVPVHLTVLQKSLEPVVKPADMREFSTV